MSHEDWKPLVVIGDVEMWENEGGFRAPTIYVKGRGCDDDGLPLVAGELDRFLYQWAHGSLPDGDRGGCVDDDKITQGFLRITVERLE